MDIPVYLINGFLNGGKTNFINGILSDGFCRDRKTLLLCCEEGEEEYQSKFLRNTKVINFEDEDDFNKNHLKELEKKYRPQQVLLEYNGMWPLQKLNEVLPDNWLLLQIMTFVEAPTFENYAKNMGQIMMEKIINADVVVFNRCTPEIKQALRSRNLRLVNRRAQMYLENEDGSSEEYFTGNERPFDMDQEVIEISDDDYGVWYVDVMDYPMSYEGKKVRVTLEMCHSRQVKGLCCPGRFAMVCCENDVTFMGLVAKGDELKKFKNHDWIDVVAEIHAEKSPAYEDIGPVLYVKSIKACEKPNPETVSF